MKPNASYKAICTDPESRVIMHEGKLAGKESVIVFHAAIFWVPLLCLSIFEAGSMLGISTPTSISE